MGGGNFHGFLWMPAATHSGITLNSYNKFDQFEGVSIMPEAVGVIQTLGFPPVLAAADAMVKAARVTLVYFDLAERAEFLVAIRGTTSEVVPAVAAGVEAAQKVYGESVITYYVVPNPPENVEAVLPLRYTEASEPFR